MRAVKQFLALLCTLATWQAGAVAVRIDVLAPTYGPQRVLLYRYDELFTGRTTLLAHAQLDAAGRATLESDVSGTVKATVRIGEVSADLWLRGGTYTIDFPQPDAKAPRSINGTTRVDPVFKDLDPMDVNALLSDLNSRLDAFLAEDLATDREAGMQAADLLRKRKDRLTLDTVDRPNTLFISPRLSKSKLDTFEHKLRRFYAEVKDPWFWQNLEYGIAGLRLGPNVNERELFNAHIKGRPVLYDVPEYVRFVGSLFQEHLMRYTFREKEDSLVSAIARADGRTVMQLMAANDFLKQPQLCELVMLIELHGNHPGKVFDRKGILSILQATSESSPFPEHRTIARNMVWDLTMMKRGGTLPSLVLRDPEGAQARVDTMLHDATCLIVTASWCTYCEQEMAAFDVLYKEYRPYMHVIGIALDRNMNDLDAYTKAHPQRDWPWLFGGDDPTITDLLRLHSVPAFYLLNGNELVYSPAPPPSNGMAAILHRMKTEVDERNKLKPQLPPKRPQR